MKKFMSRKMKIFITLLASLTVGCYIAAAVVLYNSDFKVANYISNWSNRHWVFDWDYMWDGNNTVDTLEKELPNTIENIDIKSTSSDVAISFYEGNTLKLDVISSSWSENAEDYVRTFTIVDKTVSIETKEAHNRFNTSFKLYIPTIYKGNLSITSTSGNLDLLSGDLNNTSFSTHSGRVKISNSTTKDLNIQTSSGDVNISDSNSTKTRFRTSSGSINASGTFGELVSNTSSGRADLFLRGLGNTSSITTTSGDVILEIDDNIGYKTTFNTNSGDIKCNSKGIDISNNKSYSITNGDASKFIDVSTSSGNLKFK